MGKGYKIGIGLIFMDEEVLAEAAYVVSSHYRSEVMIALDNVIETPTSISKKTNIKRDWLKSNNPFFMLW